ncbi:MAG TPA: ABC transporter ATP-binding protein [Croceibacterium sp.]|jgi:ABC-type Fe3+/spermidine/putrescine transport system ATPase subunit|nr:ABC transporter ATP-binding protein [Croceibacterium sp.]
MTTIRLDGLTRTFGAVRAVDDISATIADGELFTLLGPSGCGKTTLLRMIAGFCDVERGGIYFDDTRIDTLPAHQRNIGMVFQNYAIFPNMTVAQNVAYGLRARKVPRQDIARRVAEALAMVELPDHGERFPHEISGGQLQRVAIARCLVIRPSVLLFDEPLSNLDAQLRVHMRVEIRKLQQSLGLTTIYVTHDQEEALAISDRIAVLRGGRIEQADRPEVLYHAPKTAFVGSFMGATNMLPGIVAADGETVSAAGAVFGLARKVGVAGDRVQLSIRPEMLRLAAPGGGGPVLQARVTLREFLGPVQRLHAVLPDGTAIRISALGREDLPARPGEAITLAYEPAHITIFADS